MEKVRWGYDYRDLRQLETIKAHCQKSLEKYCKFYRKNKKASPELNEDLAYWNYLLRKQKFKMEKYFWKHFGWRQRARGLYDKYRTGYIKDKRTWED